MLAGLIHISMSVYTYTVLSLLNGVSTFIVHVYSLLWSAPCDTHTSACSMFKSIIIVYCFYETRAVIVLEKCNNYVGDT